jgi:hypothetical protein
MNITFIGFSAPGDVCAIAANSAVTTAVESIFFGVHILFLSSLRY